MGDFKKIDEMLKGMEKKYGTGSVFVIDSKNEDTFNNIKRWELDSLNSMYLTNGGIPKGRMIEIYGPEAAGKTSRACYYGAQVQKSGDLVAYIDVEHALSIEYAKSFGLDITKCIFSQPDSGEQAIDICEDLVKSGLVKLIIVDSIAALTPLAELEGSTGDQQMGAQARLMGKACRKLSSLIGNAEVTIIWINQLRMKIGVMYGNPETTPGGMAIKFYSSIREEVRRREFIENDKKETIGMISTVKSVKNKVGVPFKKIEMKIIYGKGVQIEEEFIDFAVSLEIIKRRGTWYFYNDISLGQGRENALEELKKNSELYNEVKVKTKERILKKDILLKQDIVPEEKSEEIPEVETRTRKKREKKNEEVKEDKDEEVNSNPDNL